MRLSDSENTPCRCDDCGEVTPAGQLDIIKDIEERLSPGSIVPAGQCPHCAALAYYADGYAPSGSAQAVAERTGATTSALKRAEGFIAGFEDDPTQEGVSDLLGAIRDAIAGAPRDDLQFIRDAVRAYDDKLDDKANDGANARPPTGDDYNEITYLVLMGAAADPVRAAAHDMLGFLREFIDGAEIKGRWLDETGAAIDGCNDENTPPEGEEGATWEPYTQGETEAWLEGMAARARDLIAKAEGRS